MKKIYAKPKRAFFVILGIVFLITVVINSCKKEEKQTQQDLARENLISKAKDWYQKTYPVTVNKSTLKTQGSGSSGSNDFSQILKPDWEKAATYNRLNNGVIEMPLDSAAKLAMVDKSVNVQSFDFSKSYSKSSFLILNDGTNYSAYIMTIVADSSYLKNDFSKLSNNTYRKHDKDFSGYLLYYTPKGVFVSGWYYNNGKIKKAVSTTTSSSLKPESVASSKLKVLGCSITGFVGVTVGYINGYPNTYFYDYYYFISCEMEYIPDPQVGFNPPGGTSGSPTIIPPDTIKIGHVCDNLTPDQVHTIVTTVNNFITADCATKFLSNKLKNINFTFCISGGNNAGYVPSTKEIDFSSDYAATRIDLLEHEMFHAYQDQTYSAFINYGPGNPGNVNMEFEQAVFNDMVNGTTDGIYLSNDQDLKTRYSNWIQSMTNSLTTYPKLNPNSTVQTDIDRYNSFINTYNGFLNEFNNVPNNPYHSTILNLTPTALINMFNQINRNC